MTQIKIAKEVAKDFQWFTFPYNSFWLRFLGFTLKIPALKKRKTDSRSRLIELGFKIIGEATADDPYYLCEFPEEWTMRTENLWDIVLHPEVEVYTTTSQYIFPQVYFFKRGLI